MTADPGSRRTPDPGAAAPSELSLLTRLGQFVILERLGAGAMGVVYAAYDEDLDRKVAIKLLRTHDAEARERLQREAQALARLSHPNVVQVHQIGQRGDDLYLVMELVEGRNLRAWLREKPSLREALTVCLAAGRGLAAAHRAGLVHRDLKPENVLVESAGEGVWVVDFGLARAHTAAPESAELELETLGDGDALGEPRSSPLTSELTRAGTLLGTPPYMAPELFSGQVADARSDQYAFCIMLHEAMYGTRPFTGRTLRALAREVLRGTIPDAPPGSRAPGWIRRVMLRGLAREPDRRWPSMDALLDALEADPARIWRRRGLALVAAAGLVVAALLVQRWWNVREQVCSGSADRLAEVWSEEPQVAIQAALRATGAAYAEAAVAHVDTVLEDHGTRWSEGHRDACEATQVRREQSEAMMDARMRCLDRDLQGFEAALEVLEQADRLVVKNAAQIVGGLPDVARCADVEFVTAEVAPPTDAAAATRVRDIRQQLALQGARARAGTTAGVLEDSARSLAEAEEVGYRPLVAEALLSYGELQRQAGAYAEAATLMGRAYAEADAVGDALVAPRWSDSDSIRPSASWVKLRIVCRTARCYCGRSVGVRASLLRCDATIFTFPTELHFVFVRMEKPSGCKPIFAAPSYGPSTVVERSSGARSTTRSVKRGPRCS